MRDLLGARGAAGRLRSAGVVCVARPDPGRRSFREENSPRRRHESPSMINTAFSGKWRVRRAARRSRLARAQLAPAGAAAVVRAERGAGGPQSQAARPLAITRRRGDVNRIKGEGGG